MFNFTYIRLKPTEWKQEIRADGESETPALRLRAECTALVDSDLLLTDGRKLSDLILHLTIFPGDMPRADRDRVKLPEKALGGIWWDNERVFVHGWFYLRTTEYQALWGQLMSGNYLEPTIELTVSPVSEDSAWTTNPLSIESAVFQFGGNPPKQELSTNKTARYTERQWAAIFLFIVVAATIFAPRDSIQANDVAAAILVVGGLLLWFQDHRDR